MIPKSVMGGGAILLAVKKNKARGSSVLRTYGLPRRNFI